jgi:hypothetical protein
LKIHIEYGKIRDECSDKKVFPRILRRKEDILGKSLNGKELGKGISQRKDGSIRPDLQIGLVKVDHLRQNVYRYDPKATCRAV